MLSPEKHFTTLDKITVTSNHAPSLYSAVPTVSTSRVGSKIRKVVNGERNSFILRSGQIRVQKTRQRFMVRTMLFSLHFA